MLILGDLFLFWIVVQNKNKIVSFWSFNDIKFALFNNFQTLNTLIFHITLFLNVSSFIIYKKNWDEKNCNEIIPTANLLFCLKFNSSSSCFPYLSAHQIKKRQRVWNTILFALISLPGRKKKRLRPNLHQDFLPLRQYINMIFLEHYYSLMHWNVIGHKMDEFTSFRCCNFFLKINVLLLFGCWNLMTGSSSSSVSKKLG